MAKYTIYTESKGFYRIVEGVKFVNGLGFTDDEEVVKKIKTMKGFKIKKAEEKETKSESEEISNE